MGRVTLYMNRGFALSILMKETSSVTSATSNAKNICDYKTSLVVLSFLLDVLEISWQKLRV